MRSKACLALTFALAAAVSAADASQVSVSGNVRVDKESIRAHVPAESGKKISDEAINDALKSLFASGQFEDVRIVRVGEGVSVEVMERPLIASLRFEGNSRLKDNQLAEAAGVRKGIPLAEGDVEAAATAISKAYSAIGRMDATVQPRVENTQSGVSITFLIEEGEKTGVTHIWFQGNESFGEERLRSVLSTKKSGWLGWLKTNDVYDLDRVEADRAALRNFYVSQGFADARIGSVDVDRLEDGFTLGFMIEEGPRYKVASVTADSTVDGFDGVGHPAMKRLEGRFLEPSSLARVASDIEHSAALAGVVAPLVEPRVTRGDNGRAEVLFTVDAGPRIYIDRIEISGNTRTKDEVVRRELDFAEGDLLRRNHLVHAERRLKRTGLFDKVALSVHPGSAEDRAVLRIEVADRKTGEFSIGGGYSTHDGPLASISLSQANLGGTGRKGHLYASRGEHTSSYGASFTEPYLFGHRIAATTDIYHERAERESLTSRAYDEAVTGGRITFSAPLAERFSGTIGYKLEHRDVSDVDPLYTGAGIPGDPNLIRAGSSLKSSIFWALEYDALDDPSDPRDGYRLGFDQEFAGLGGDVKFLRTEASAEWFQHLVPSQDVVGRLGTKGGVVAGLGKPLSFHDHFVGGRDVVRGFARDGFGPRDASTRFHLGGTAFASATAEASMPLPLIPPEIGLRAAIFADAGTVWSPDYRRVVESGASVVGDDAAIRAAVGAGVIWNSPFGLLRADFALPVASRDGDREQVFSFSGGTRF